MTAIHSIDAIDASIRNEWHVVGTIAELPMNRIRTTWLLGQPLALGRWSDDRIGVWYNDGRFRSGHAIDPAQAGGSLPVLARFGYVWTCLGKPAHDLFEIPEVSEPNRLTINACTVGIQVSAPRAIENFLDMAHFPFVHTGHLGIEARPQVAPYDVARSSDGREVFAIHCRFFQPDTPAPLSKGFDVDYVYRVPHPYCALLYKAKAAQPERRDVIGIFCQPLNEESLNACLFGSVLQDTALYGVDLTSYRSFQLLLIGQDKGILENQRPKRLPLGTAREVPIRADTMSIAYRRWLQERGVRYGTIPAGVPAELAIRG